LAASSEPQANKNNKVERNKILRNLGILNFTFVLFSSPFKRNIRHTYYS